MERKNSRNSFLKKSTFALIGLSFLITGCNRKIFDEVIDEEKVVYYEGDYFSANYLEVSKNGMILFRIEDWNKDDIIGNIASDKYVVYLNCGKECTGRKIYQKAKVTDEYGYEFYGNSDVAQKALGISESKLLEATNLYNKYKTKIKENLEKRLK